MRRDLSRGFAINLYYSSPLPSLGEVHPHPVFAGRRLVYNSVGFALGWYGIAPLALKLLE